MKTNISEQDIAKLNYVKGLSEKIADLISPRKEKLASKSEMDPKKNDVEKIYLQNFEIVCHVKYLNFSSLYHYIGSKILSTPKVADNAKIIYCVF